MRAVVGCTLSVLVLLATAGCSPSKGGPTAPNPAPHPVPMPYKSGDVLAPTSTVVNDGVIVKIDPVSGAQASPLTGLTFDGPGSPAVAPDGTLLVPTTALFNSYYGDPPTLYQGRNPSLEVVRHTSSGFVRTTSLSLQVFTVSNFAIFALDDSLCLLGVTWSPDLYTWTSDLLLHDFKNGTIAVLAESDTVSFWQMAASSGGTFYFVSQKGTTRRIAALNLLTGQLSIVSSGGFLSDVVSIAAGTNGNVYAGVRATASDPDNKIIEVNPVTGNQSVIARAGNLGVPIRIAWEGGDSLLVASWGASGGTTGILRIDVGSGSLTTLAPMNPGGVVVVPPRIGGQASISRSLEAMLARVPKGHSQSLVLHRR